jgi:hypothetical protein
MIYNLGQIRQEVYDFFNYGTNPEQEVIRRIDQYANSVYMELLGKVGTSQLRRTVLTFSSVANDPWAVLPQVVSQILTIQDRSNNITLDKLSMKDIRYDDPGLTSSAANPRGYALVSWNAALAIEPSSASSLFIKSTNALDTDVTAYVDGVITGGYPKPASNKTSGGTTAVNLDAGTSTWIAAKKFYLGSRARGDIVLLQTSGAGTELARIPAGRSTSRYTKIQLHPKPTTVVTYHADVELSLDRLEAEMDEPLLHEDYHWLIVSGCLMRQMLKDGKHVEYGFEKKRYDVGWGQMVHKLGAQYGLGARNEAPRFSHLGPNFSNIS